jgi:hypothetical protein
MLLGPARYLREVLTSVLPPPMKENLEEGKEVVAGSSCKEYRKVAAGLLDPA